ncbi:MULTISPECIES: uroporphyrinogen-III synthase [unclassified Thioalkalivibrio]|uniref:uroporphyrinogen-III synthase n=1 Tax=unclassified Thioalkalivibrio TaxID=2621013 RepID=UPI00035C5CFF|nr:MULTISPECIES: uroporphyrinogen-III synthase [unclassified Thioalkalivibrio]
MTAASVLPEAAASGLAGRRVALPESRALEVFAGLLERRGAEVWRCPLIAIHDSPDRTAIEAWLHRAIEAPFDRLIFLTGEGFTRLTGFARSAGREDAWLAAVVRTPTLVRGPKPGRAMKPFGVRPDAIAAAPTTEGIIETLSGQDRAGQDRAGQHLAGQRIGVQLYGAEPNRRLLEFLEQAGAEVFPVWPYRYADAAETGRVTGLIEALIAGDVDAIAFTSQAQVRRLLRVARDAGREDALLAALGRTVVAAIGPVVADELRAHGVHPTVVPDGQYFMKPLVSTLARHLGAHGG